MNSHGYYVQGVTVDPKDDINKIKPVFIELVFWRRQTINQIKYIMY
jgi:hypothetical protein